MRILLAVLLLLLAPSLASAEEIGSVGYRFKWVGPNDKIVVEAFDDPDIAGITCYISRARTGGIKGMFGVAEDPPYASISCHQVGPIDAAKAGTLKKPARGLQRARLVDLQDHPGRALLGPQAPRAGLSHLYRPRDRGQPAELDQRRAGGPALAIEEGPQQHPARRLR